MPVNVCCTPVQAYISRLLEKRNCSSLALTHLYTGVSDRPISSFARHSYRHSVLAVWGALRTTILEVSHYKSSAVAEMGDRLATIDIGSKNAGPVVPHTVGVSWVPI